MKREKDSSFDLNFLKATDGESYQELMEKKRRRAERFGTEIEEVSFPGMVPTHKRYENTKKKKNPNINVTEIFSKEACEKRQERFPKANEPFVETTFRVLEQALLKKMHKKFSPSVKLPSQEVRVVSKNSVQRPNTLYIYGVDSLKTEQLFNYFQTFLPSFIEWLDDSSCNIIFQNQEVTDAALASLGSTLPTDFAFTEVKIDEIEENENTTNESEENNENENENGDNEVIEENENKEEQGEDEEIKENSDEEIQDDDKSTTVEESESGNNSNELKEYIASIPDNILLWRVGRLVKHPRSCIMMRYGTIDDKRPDFKTRLQQYREKNKPRERKNRRGRHEPYSRANSGRKSRIEEISNKFDTDGLIESNARTKRFGGIISSILTDKDQ